MCEKHQREEVKLFCVSCEKPCCYLCAISPDHKQIDVLPLEDFCKKSIEELKKVNLLNNITPSEELRKRGEEIGKLIVEVEKVIQETNKVSIKNNKTQRRIEDVIII